MAPSEPCPRRDVVHQFEEHPKYFTPRRSWARQPATFPAVQVRRRKALLCSLKAHIASIIAHVCNADNALAEANEKPASPLGLKPRGLRRAPEGQGALGIAADCARRLRKKQLHRKGQGAGLARGEEQRRQREAGWQLVAGVG